MQEQNLCLPHILLLLIVDTWLVFIDISWDFNENCTPLHNLQKCHQYEVAS